VVGIRVAAVGTYAGLVFAGATLMVPAFVALVTPLLQRVLRRTSGLVGAWNWGQVRSRPGHTAVTIGALAAGVAFALGITTLLTSYRRDFVGWIDQTFVADVFVNAGQDVSLLGGPTLSLDLLDEIERLPGVRHAAPWRLLEVEFRGKPIIVQGMGEDAIDRAYPDLRLDHDAGEVVVSETLAERYHLAPGDHLALPAPVAPVDLTIRAVVPDYVVDLGNVKVGWRTFARHFAERSANVILVDAVPGTDVAALARRIERIVDGRWNAVTLTRAELRATVNALIEESFALTRALELLAVLVTICAMVNATSAAIIDRADELVTLRALGMRRRDVARLLMTEGGLLGLLGSLVGLLAGGLLGRTFVTTVARAVAGFRLALHWPLGTMIALVLLSTATAATAALIVGRRSVRRPAVLDAA
jgi:putative ABC transport system permease protein